MANKKVQRKKKHLALTVSLVVIATLEKALAVTQISDSNFHSAIETCLGTNPVDGLCSSSEYGSMPDWDVSLVTDMSGYDDGTLQGFGGKSTFNGDISKWNTEKVTDMYVMFGSASAFNQDIGIWNTAQVISMGAMFSTASAFNQDIGGWNTAQVVSMYVMFRDASAFNQDIGRWNTAQVYDMIGMFTSASTFNQDIGNWNTARVTDMQGMFYLASAFNQDIGGWNTAQVLAMYDMFHNTFSFNQNISSWTGTAATTAQGSMFSGATAFQAKYTCGTDGPASSCNEIKRYGDECKTIYFAGVALFQDEENKENGNLVFPFCFEYLYETGDSKHFSDEIVENDFAYFIVENYEQSCRNVKEFSIYGLTSYGSSNPHTASIGVLGCDTNRTLLCSLMELFPLGREPGPSSQPPDDNRLTESPDCELPPVELQYVHIAEVPSSLVYIIEPPVRCNV
ncbi:unnamed protein product [Bathycoccus prasinos]